MLRNIATASTLAVLALGCDASGHIVAVDGDGDHMGAPTAFDGTDHIAAVAYDLAPAYFMATSDDSGALRVVALNREWTECPEATMQPSCVVDRMDYERIGLDEPIAAQFTEAFANGHGIVHGRLDTIPDRTKPIRVLHADEAWRAVLDVPPGNTVFEAEPIDIMCVVAPCPEYEVTPVNHEPLRYVIDVDLWQVDEVPPSVLERGYEALDRAGLLVAGTLAYFDVDEPEAATTRALPPLGGWILTADLFYLPVR